MAWCATRRSRRARCREERERAEGRKNARGLRNARTRDSEESETVGKNARERGRAKERTTQTVSLSSPPPSRVLAFFHLRPLAFFLSARCPSRRASAGARRSPSERL